MPSEVLGLNLSQAQVITITTMTKYLNLFTIQPRLVSGLLNENIFHFIKHDCVGLRSMKGA